MGCLAGEMTAELTVRVWETEKHGLLCSNGCRGRRSIGRMAALVVWNDVEPVISYSAPGTLTANLRGGYLVGIAVEYFHHNTVLPPEARLFAITGFLGGLTTFSTFSAETVTL